MTDDENEPRRLTVLLNDPSAEWSQIRDAMRAKTRGQGVTNHAIMTAISTTSETGEAEQSVENQAAKDTSERSGDGGEEDVLKPLDTMDRRASLKSQKSNGSQRFSRRGILRRQASRRRSSLKSRGSAVSFATTSGSSFGSSSRSISSRFAAKSNRSATSTMFDSVNMMDFGVSQRALNAAQDEDARTSASLDDDVLEELEEEFAIDERRRSSSGGTSMRELILNWRHESSRRMISNSNSDDSSLDGSTKSEGDADFVEDCGDFMDWPSLANIMHGNIVEKVEKQPDQVKREVEEWNIEDYEHTYSGSSRNNSLRSSGSLQRNLTRTIQMFRRSSTASTSSQEVTADLSKVKQTLLNAKSKDQQAGAEVNDNANTNKRVLGLGRLFRSRSSLDDSKRSSMRSSAKSSNSEASKHEPIWVRGGESDSDDGDHYKDMYTQAPRSPTQNKKGFGYF